MEERTRGIGEDQDRRERLVKIETGVGKIEEVEGKSEDGGCWRLRLRVARVDGSPVKRGSLEDAGTKIRDLRESFLSIFRVLFVH